jgi:malate synthase
MASSENIEVAGPKGERYEEVLSPEALVFLADLEGQFGQTRSELLLARAKRREELSQSGTLDFLASTRPVREDSTWQVPEAPQDLQKRWVEITGPTERKMLVNALNSGANVFMADFEDANSPTWDNMVGGQLNLSDAIRRRVDFVSPEGKSYRLGSDIAVLMARPRGWHLPERHVLLGGKPMSASLFDFGLYFFHNARELLERGSAPYFYLPKLEHYLEARLWEDVFTFSEEALGLPLGTIRATVLIETITAAFQMEEILYELRRHAAGLNAGRWDYMFSVIKNFRDQGERFLLPDRNSVTMTVPFMRAYTELLVKTCHRRGAFAIGGMAAFVPSRRDPEVNERALAKVREDKQREAADGFDGSWVAHPDLVPVCREVFEAALAGRPNQLGRSRGDVQVTSKQLLDVASTPGDVTEAGLRNNVAVALRYLASWLSGTGAVAIFNLMEDTATAEIARSQVWQWAHNGARLSGNGEPVTAELVRRVVKEELEVIRNEVGDAAFACGNYSEARELFENVALADEFQEFLTIPGYQYLD